MKDAEFSAQMAALAALEAQSAEFRAATRALLTESLSIDEMYRQGLVIPIHPDDGCCCPFHSRGGSLERFCDF